MITTTNQLSLPDTIFSPCGYCNIPTRADTPYKLDNNPLCETHKDLVRCYKCRGCVSKDTILIVQPSDANWCLNCVRTYSFVCDSCSRRWNRAYRYTVQDDSLCETCYENAELVECSNCQNSVYSGNEHYCQSCENDYCQNCTLDHGCEPELEERTADDKALMERGVITCDLSLNSRSYVTDFLFNKFKKEIATQAGVEVKAIKAELEKASK